MSAAAEPARPTRLKRGDLVLVAGGPPGPDRSAPPPPPSTGVLVAQLQALARLYQDGCRRLLITETAEGPPDVAVRHKQALKAFAALLASRGLEPMPARRADAESKAARALRAHREEALTVANWRSSEPDPGADAAALTALQQIGSDTAEALFAAAPRIDPVKCTGCDACLRVCPGDVLRQINDENGLSCYQAACASCDACGLCVEVCASNAIDIDPMTRTPESITLKSWTCAACGVSTHAPAAQAGPGDGLCPTCRRTGHHKKLFQVLP